MNQDGFTREDDDPVPANLKLARLHYAAFACQDIEGVLAGLDPDVVIQIHDEHGRGAGDEFEGLEAARAFFEGIFGAVADPKVDIERLRGDGNRVLAQVTICGTARMTGRSGAIPAVHLFTMHDGLITEIRTHRPDWRRYEDPEARDP